MAPRGLPPFEATTGCVLFRAASARTGVVGVDATYSFSLGEGRSLWLFGDTFVGTFKADGTRQISSWQRSAAALTDTSDLATCFAGARFEGAPLQEAIVRPPSEDRDKRAGWPGEVLQLGAQTWAFYAVYEVGPEGGLDLKRVGYGVLQGAGAPPRFHRSQDEALLFGPSEPTFGQAALVHEGAVFVYGVRERKGADGWTFKDVYLAKVAPSEIANRAAYRFFERLEGGAPVWTAELPRAAVLFTGEANTVRWVEHLGAFLSTYVEPLGQEVRARLAPTPWGPWSQAETLVRCELPPGAYCYHGRFHPQLGSPDGRRLVVTYDTNGWKLEDMVRQGDVYWPRLVEVTFR